MKKKSKKSEEIPEDIGLVIGTKEEALWKQVEQDEKQELERLEKALTIHRAVLELSLQKQLEQKYQDEALF
jgi:Mg2+ and Co2+ transporter CorA